MSKELVSYAEKMAAEAKKFADAEPVSGMGGARISLKGGIMTLVDGDEKADLEGNQICAIIVDHVMVNEYYASAYSAETTASPKCFAIAHKAERMYPHAATLEHPYFEPQHDDCATCPWDKFGTAATGKGKACKNKRRLGLLLAGEYRTLKGGRGAELEVFEDVDHYAETPLIELTLPTMSAVEYGMYVKQVASSAARPPYGVFTRIYVVPDKQSQFRVKFEMLEQVPDGLLETIIGRNAMAAERLLQPFSPPREEEPKAQAGGIKGLRR